MNDVIEPQDRDEAGATSVEYALMAGLIAVVIAGMVTAFGISVNGLFEMLPPSIFG